MRLVGNWRAVLRHAWSIRIILAAALLSVLEAALPYLGLPIPPGTLAVLAALLSLAAAGARLVAQQAFGRLAEAAQPDWEDGDGHDASR